MLNKRKPSLRNTHEVCTVHILVCAEFYEKVAAYKAKGLKVLVAIGGWNDSAGDKYSRLVNNPGARARFISHVTDFIEKHNFDGLDLDWEYPKCWQV
jgi:chitinase